MAIWQFSFNMIPKGNLGGLGDDLPLSLDKKIVDELIDWHGYNIKKESVVKLSRKLPQAKSWSDDIKQFGALDKTCVEFFYEDNHLRDVLIRLDLRDISKSLVDLIIDFIVENNSLIVTSDGTLIRASFYELAEQIKCSQAYSFLENPEMFLRALDESK